MKKLVLLFSAVICSIAINAQMKVFNNRKEKKTVTLC